MATAEKALSTRRVAGTRARGVPAHAQAARRAGSDTR